MTIVQKSAYKVMYWTGTRKDRVKGPFEGVAVGNGSGDIDVIVSTEGKAVKSIWDFEVLLYDAYINFSLHKDRYDKGKYARKKK